MWAGILPTTIHNNKLYFLFGKENKYEDSAPGFSDFGGGTDSNESLFDTAVREAGEELTGFLGNDTDIKKMLKKYGTYNIDYSSNNSSYSVYRMHIFPFEYDLMLPFYYNNNQRFLQKRLDPNIIKNTTIFEKAEIRWICIDDIIKMRPQFRNYFRNIVDKIHIEKDDIKKFIMNSIKKSNKSNKSNKNKTRKKKDLFF